MVWVSMISPNEDEATTTKDDRLRSEEVQIFFMNFAYNKFGWIMLIMLYMSTYIIIIVQIPVARSKLQVQEQLVYFQWRNWQSLGMRRTIHKWGIYSWHNNRASRSSRIRQNTILSASLRCCSATCSNR